MYSGYAAVMVLDQKYFLLHFSAVLALKIRFKSGYLGFAAALSLGFGLDRLPALVLPVELYLAICTLSYKKMNAIPWAHHNIPAFVGML